MHTGPRSTRTSPNPKVPDFHRFQHWFSLEAAEGRVDPLLVPSSLAPERAADASSQLNWAPRSSLVPGMTVAGYLDASHSIGESGRLTTAAVRAAGIPFQSVVYDAGKMSFAEARSSNEPCANYDTNLVIVNADQFAEFAANAGAAFFEGRYTIAQWAWEVEDFPARWHGVFDLVDEVWALSDFTRRSVQAVTDKPVFAAPLPVLVPEVAAGIGRASFGLPQSRFIFLFCLDLLSVVERKNPVGVIDAFKRAFAIEEGPVLVVKTVNGESKEMDLEMVRYAAADRTDVLVIDDPLPRPELGSLMATADCYVSLHRSEGFGLTMAESMALGKPVIATAYSGNLDFMTDENSFLVPFSWAPVPSGAGPYPVGTRWADPDLDAAAAIDARRRRFPRPGSRGRRAWARGCEEVSQPGEAFRVRPGPIRGDREASADPWAATENGCARDRRRRAVWPLERCDPILERAVRGSVGGDRGRRGRRKGDRTQLGRF